MRTVVRAGIVVVAGAVVIGALTAQPVPADPDDGSTPSVGQPAPPLTFAPGPPATATPEAPAAPAAPAATVPPATVAPASAAVSTTPAPASTVPAAARTAAAAGAEYQAARAALQAKDWAGAVVKLRLVVAADPANPDIHNYLGYAYRKAGDLTSAMRSYGEALRLDPKHKGALEYQGEAYLLRNQPAQARTNLARLEAICGTTCVEYKDLSRAIAQHKPPAKNAKTAKTAKNVKTAKNAKGATKKAA